MPLSDFAGETAHRLTIRYVIALAAVALLSIAGQVFVQIALSRQGHDAKIINLAGRQRQYSQALCKGVLAIPRLAPADAAAYRAETVDIFATWQRLHTALRDGDADLELPFLHSPAMTDIFLNVEPRFIKLANVIRDLTTIHSQNDHTVIELLNAQRQYLEQMEQVVNQLDREAGERVTFIRILEVSLFALLGVVLIIEGLLVFRPVVLRIRDEISAREQAEQTTIEREVAELSGRLERRIGQDIHDGLGQVLTGISFQAKALQRRLGSGPEAESAADITTHISQAISQTRDLARILHPIETDPHSFGTALRDLSTTCERVFGVHMEVLWDDELPIPMRAIDCEDHDTPPSMHLFRIAQETVSNAIRHGKARHLSITGRQNNHQCEMLIIDDGVGFNPPTTHELQHHHAGMGLRIMAFRAQRIGATFAIERRTEGGMRVTLQWISPAKHDK